MMVTPQFEEGSLEHKIVQGIFQHATNKMGQASWDVYRNFGILVRGQINISYQIEVIRMFADYIREQESQGKYIFETLELLPTYFEFDLN